MVTQEPQQPQSSVQRKTQEGSWAYTVFGIVEADPGKYKVSGKVLGKGGVSWQNGIDCPGVAIAITVDEQTAKMLDIGSVFSFTIHV